MSGDAPHPASKWLSRLRRFRCLSYSGVGNDRFTPWVSLYRDFCDATSDPLLRQITLKFCAKYLSKLHITDERISLYLRRCRPALPASTDTTRRISHLLRLFAIVLRIK
jgi:hypothetical protein